VGWFNPGNSVRAEATLADGSRLVRSLRLGASAASGARDTHTAPPPPPLPVATLPPSLPAATIPTAPTAAAPVPAGTPSAGTLPLRVHTRAGTFTADVEGTAAASGRSVTAHASGTFKGQGPDGSLSGTLRFTEDPASGNTTSGTLSATVAAGALKGTLATER